MKNEKRWNITFKVLMWLFIVSAALTVWSMISALVTQEVTIFNYVMKCIDNILGSLLLAFICGKTTVTLNNEEEDND